MKRMQWLLSTTLLFTTLFSILAGKDMYQINDNLIPRTVLFGNADRGNPKISPDGSMISFLAPYNGVMNIWIQPISQVTVAQPVTFDSNRGIQGYWWGYDNTTLFYLQDINGNENWHIYSLDCVTGCTKNLTPFDGVQAKLVRYSKYFSTMMLIALNKDDRTRHDVYSLDTQTGELTLVIKNPGDVAAWYADEQLQLRIAYVTQDDGNTTLLYRDDNNASWQELVTWDIDATLSGQFIGFAAAHNELYLTDGSESNTACLIKMNAHTKEKQVLIEDPVYDAGSSVILHPESSNPVCAFFDRERCDTILFDDSFADDFALLKSINSGDMQIISYDNSFRWWVVRYVSSNRPVEFYLYDQQAKQATFLFANQAELYNYQLAETEPILFQARDGLDIHGYITYPTTTTAKTDLPIVLFVHGGPWARDCWTYSSIVQLFANRGYACLQINYRASIGYGKEFVKVSNKQWGKSMHTDLVDGVNWLIDQKIADPTKIAICGGSYGGYAALAGAAFTPDLFCCAVDICGVSNLLTLFKSIPAYWKLFLIQMRIRIGDPETEEELLKTASPLFSANNIKIPMLIGQGANDPRVVQAEADQIVDALQKHNIPHRYILFPDEGHGFVKPGNRLVFFAAMEEFLAQNLGGLFEA
ncbi:MAG TPA: S9 family peptidase [Candidatus Babeliales bacterium]|nr:S9 family peptidase [Candidatus Babeliales bacterium]